MIRFATLIKTYLVIMYEKNVPSAAKQLDRKESGEHSDIPVEALIRDLRDARGMFYLRRRLVWRQFFL